jgi:SAM-dependent methyltransferase
MSAYYGEDLAHVHAAAFGTLAEHAAAHLLTRIRALPFPVCRVVDIGCGAGITTRAFCAAGLDVVGIDPSAALISRARAAVPDARFMEASVYETTIPECQLIAAVGETLNYHEDLEHADEKVRAFLHSAHTALTPGGLLAFDVIVSGEPNLSGKTWAAGDDWAVLVQVNERSAQSSLIREIEIFRAQSGAYRRSRERHSLRVFRPDDLRAWLSERGFNVEMGHAYGDHRLLPRRLAFFALRH